QQTAVRRDDHIAVLRDRLAVLRHGGSRRESRGLRYLGPLDGSGRVGGRRHARQSYRTPLADALRRRRRLHEVLAQDCNGISLRLALLNWSVCDCFGPRLNAPDVFAPSHAAAAAVFHASASTAHKSSAPLLAPPPPVA